MITIIENGTKHTQKCEGCGCLFSYEDEDIHWRYIFRYVRCPQCGNDILVTSYHAKNDNEKEDEE